MMFDPMSSLLHANVRTLVRRIYSTGSRTYIAWLLAALFISSGGEASYGASTILGPAVDEFDAAGFCWGALRTDEVTGLAEGRAGVLPQQDAPALKNAIFSYLVSTTRADVGEYGDLTRCRHDRILFTVLNDGKIVKEALEQLQYDKYRRALIKFEHSSRFRYFKSIELPDDSIGGCLLPLRWIQFGDQQYAFLSVARDGGVATPIIPDDGVAIAGIEKCQAWGARRIAYYSLVSSPLDSFSIDDQSLFVEAMDFNQGFFFRGLRDVNCIKSHDVFSNHFLVRRAYFDRLIRPALSATVNAHASKMLDYSLSNDISHSMSKLVVDLFAKECDR